MTTTDKLLIYVGGRFDLNEKHGLADWDTDLASAYPMRTGSYTVKGKQDG